MPEGARKRLEEARRSITAALDAGDLARAGRELDFAAVHYGGEAELHDLRGLLERARAARMASEAWTGPAQSPGLERAAAWASWLRRHATGRARLLVPAALALLALVTLLAAVSFCAA
jgi:hypothetical protein